MEKIEDDLNKYEQGLFEGEIKVVQSGNSLLAMDSQGNFYSIRKDPSDKSKYAIGNRLAEAPSSFKTKDGMDFKKEGDYALNGNKVYSNSKGELFAMNDLNTKIAKGTQLVKSEPFGAMALQSSLVVGDDGKKYTEAKINSMDKKQQEELKPKLEKVRIHIKDVSDITDKDALTGQVIVDYNDRDLKSGRVGADVEVKRIVSGNEVAEYYYIEGSKG